MVSKTATLTADFDKVDNPELIALNDDVQLQINQAFNLPGGTANYGSIDGLVSQLATDLVGTVAFWVYYDVDSGTQEAIFGISRDASATITEILVQADFRTPANADLYIVQCVVDGVNQWVWRTPKNTLDPLVGTWSHFAIVHDGTSPKFYINGVDVTAAGTFAVSTDLTCWMYDILTTATNKADTCNVGVLERNGGNILPTDAKLDAIKIWDTDLSAGQIAAEVAKDRIAGPETAANLVCHLPFRGNTNDVSGQGNNLTAVGTAAVVNDPDSGYATTSPETYVRTAGQEYWIDAGEGNYVDIISITDNETAPAGTSIEFEYAFYANPTRSGASWSGTPKSIGDISTDAAADETQERYFHFKELSNEDDGGDTPTLSDVTVNYNVVAAGGGNSVFKSSILHSKILQGVA